MHGVLYVLQCRHTGLDVKSYRYYDAETSLADFNSMCEDLNVGD